ncbi:MAG: hypothetical protein Q7S98_02175, partial [Deltaproteobacteria bacterium]|nr:hypothetical protein [Deltaproteobacteria bacterium]
MLLEDGGGRIDRNMVDFNSRLIDPRLQFFRGLAANNNPDILEEEDYQLFLGTYRLNPGDNGVPTFDEMTAVLEEGNQSHNWQRALELQNDILKDIVCTASVREVNYLFKEEAPNISTACSALTTNPIPKPVEKISRPYHRGATVKGVLTIAGIAGGMATTSWATVKVTQWGSRQIARIPGTPLWQRYVAEVQLAPPELVKIPFWSRAGMATRVRAAFQFSRSARAVRLLGYMTMARWADDATQSLLHLENRPSSLINPRSVVS